MKDKTPLLLIEQMIMILVFALVAALCLRGFAYAADLSKQIQQQEQAAILAQNTAELLKNEGTIQQEISFYDVSLQPITDSADWHYCLNVQYQPSHCPGREKAQIRVDNADDETLIVLTVGWQEAVS